MPLAIPALFLVVAFIVAATRSTFTEFDGLMQLFAGRDLLGDGVYDGWPSHFWPPLYPLLTALLEPLFGGFWAGKVISVLSASALLVVAFHATRRFSGSGLASLAAQALIAVNPLFFLNAIQAQNHMLDAALLCGAILAIVSARDNRGWILAGCLAGAATMTRYTSVVVLPAGVLIAAFAIRDAQRARRVALFAAPAMIVAAPWLIQNWIVHGSPIATWQHLNIGSAFLEPSGSLAKWWWSKQAAYQTLGDVWRADPSAYWANVGRNARGGFGHLLISTGAAIVTVPFVLVRGRGPDGRRGQTTIGVAITLGFLLIIQAFLRDYLFIASSVLLTCLGVAGAEQVAHRWRASRVAAGVIALALTVSGIVVTNVRTGEFFDRFNADATSEAAVVASVIRADTGSNPNPVVMASHPVFAYECGCRYLMAPLHFEGTVEEYVRYRGLPRAVLDYVPRAPHDTPLADADYLVYNRALKNFLPRFSLLIDSPSTPLPSGWTALYRTRDLLLVRLP